MRVVLQRVREASVTVDGEIVGAIGPGVVALAAIHKNDTPREIRKMAEKCVHLRIFPGEGGHFEESVLQRGGAILAVSQFTLYGDCRKGRRPSLAAAARPDEANQLFNRFVEEIRTFNVEVATGRFGAMMQVHLVNDGPVTFQVEF